MAKEDLIPMSMRSKEEVKEIARKGGINSGKTRRNKALLKDCINILMEQKVIDEETGKKITGAEQLSVNLWKKAVSEMDTAKAAKAFEVLRDTSGQKPIEKVMVAEVDQNVIDEVEAMMNDDEE
jgi:hypothetical protein